MKVATDFQIFGVQQYGGISKYHMRLAEELSKSSVDCRIFAPFHKNEYLKNDTNDLVSGFFTPRLLNLSPSLVKIFNQIISQSVIPLWHPDVLHMSYYPTIDLKGSAQKVITVHDMIHEKFPNYFPNGRRLSTLKRKAIGLADHIITISENTKKDLMDIFGTSAEKISVVYHGYDDIESRKPDFVINQPFILFVGNRSGYKNFDLLIEAVSQSTLLKDFFVLAFGGRPFSRPEMEIIKAKGLDKRVFQLGGNDEVLSHLYQKAESFVYPSEYEGFGIPLLESMSKSCPVIASDSSCFPEIGGNACEYFEKNNIDSLMVSLEKVCLDSEFKKSLVMKGTQRVNNFSWAKCAMETKLVYESLNSKHQ